MLLPFSIALPFHVAILRVVNAVVALERAVASFGSIARLKLFAAGFTRSSLDSFHGIQQIALSFQRDAGATVDRISEHHDICDVSNPENNDYLRLVVFSNRDTLYADPLAPEFYSSNEPSGTDDADHWKYAASNLLDMDATITVEHTTNESRLKSARKFRELCNFRFCFHNTVARQVGAHNYRADVDSRITVSEIVGSLGDWGGGLHGGSKAVYMPSISVGKAEHHDPLGVASVCHEKPKPVGFFVGVDFTKISFINLHGARSSHAVIIQDSAYGT